MAMLVTHTVSINLKYDGEPVGCECGSAEFLFSARDQDPKAFGGCNIIDGIRGCFLLQCQQCKTVHLLNSCSYHLQFLR